jgi:hypothetical protein
MGRNLLHREILRRPGPGPGVNARYSYGLAPVDISNHLLEAIDAVTRVTLG